MPVFFEAVRTLPHCIIIANRRASSRRMGQGYSPKSNKSNHPIILYFTGLVSRKAWERILW